MSRSSALYTAAFALLATTSLVSAQGDPQALVSGTRPNPTTPWTQWQPKPTYALDRLPIQYMGANRIPGYSEPQYGWNQCAGDSWNQKSNCQTAYLNDVNDWCIWGPGPDTGLPVGSMERTMVAYCTTNKHGTRLIPDGTISGAHFLKTPNYVQVSGTGDFTKIGIPLNDDGGEMDYAGADDLGNPIGGVVFTTAIPGTDGTPTMVRHWTNFMSWNQYCFRACWGDNSADRCEHKLDIMGCRFNMPSTSGYTDGFETCEGENAPFQAVYGGSTFAQGDAVTPQPHPPAASSCSPVSSVRHGLFAVNAPSSSSVVSNTGSVPTATIISATNRPTTSPSSSGGSTSNANTSGAVSTATTIGGFTYLSMAVVAGFVCVFFA